MDDTTQDYQALANCMSQLVQGLLARAVRPTSILLGERQRETMAQQFGFARISGAVFMGLPVWFTGDPDLIEVEHLGELQAFVPLERCLKASRKAP
jgi:hypothetical protein